MIQLEKQRRANDKHEKTENAKENEEKKA